MDISYLGYTSAISASYTNWSSIFIGHEYEGDFCRLLIEKYVREGTPRIKPLIDKIKRK